MSIEIRGLDCFEMENKQEYDQLYTLLKFNFARLDNQSSPRLKPMVLEALNGGKKNVVLDLAEVEYLDSAGFSAILAANRICIEDDGELILINTQENIRKLIKMAHLEEIINLRVNLWDAIGNIISH